MKQKRRRKSSGNRQSPRAQRQRDHHFEASAMTDQEITALFMPVVSDLDDSFKDLLSRKPLLAHYTSIEVLEKIVKTNEIWFSNPLFMNDLQEMRFGVRAGVDLFERSAEVTEACGSPERSAILRHSFRHYFSEFDLKHALDVYVFCLSEHDPKNTDGLLSMWRGYGRNGDGAALVIDSGFMTSQPGSPLLIAKVSYASEQERIAWLQQRLNRFAKVLRDHNIQNEKLYIAAHLFFTVVKIFALTSKHHGFREENEWRVIYMPDRDPRGLLKDRFDYVIGSQGVEPKLKYKLEPLPMDPPEKWTFGGIVDRIILGPSLSSPLARNSVARMLEKAGKPEFREKLISSTIPLRRA
jgi:hypothetical protein